MKVIKCDTFGSVCEIKPKDNKAYVITLINLSLRLMGRNRTKHVGKTDKLIYTIFGQK